MTFGVYVHVPFCSSRCGYCDFNTYTAAELGDAVQRDQFHEHLMREIDLVAASDPSAPPADTVFFGGGTPTTLAPAALGAIIDHLDATIGLAPQAEITTEANPDSVDAQALTELLEAGFTRLSLGMQSVAPQVLRVLERTHDAQRSLEIARLARDLGFRHVSLDLIYGTPGETESDVRRSLDAVLETGVDHCSAYALTVEAGTALARRVSRGEVLHPDPDTAADRYAVIDDVLTEAGMPWYEISNWATDTGRCRHNLGYWQGGQWWGIGPGAHAHRHGVRSWNRKHPRSYVAAIRSGELPIEGAENLDSAQQSTERIMLGLRTREGLPADLVADRDRLRSLSADDLIDAEALQHGSVVLTRRGRLLADTVIQAVLAEPT